MAHSLLQSETRVNMIQLKNSNHYLNSIEKMKQHTFRADGDLEKHNIQNKINVKIMREGWTNYREIDTITKNLKNNMIFCDKYTNSFASTKSGNKVDNAYLQLSQDGTKIIIYIRKEIVTKTYNYQVKEDEIADQEFDDNYFR